MQNAQHPNRHQASPFTLHKYSRQGNLYSQVLCIEIHLVVICLVKDMLYPLEKYTYAYGPSSRATPLRAINPHSLIDSATHSDQP